MNVSPASSSDLALIHPFPEWNERVRAAFSTRAGGTSTGSHASLNLGYRCGDNPQDVDANWRRVFAAEGLLGKTLVIPRMTHGDTAVAASNPPAHRSEGDSISRLEPEDADAVFTQSRELVLAVTMADCLTALIFDSTTETIAAVHAGWRGTRLGILGKTLNQLVDKQLISPRTTHIALGPCLSADALEVGPEVAAQLDANFLIKRGEKWWFDLTASNRAQAVEVGVPQGRIRIMGGCTKSEPARFFSYRRDGQRSGRMAAFISLI